MLKITTETIRLIRKTQLLSMSFTPQGLSPQFRPLEWEEITTKYLHIFKYKIKLWTTREKHTRA